MKREEIQRLIRIAEEQMSHAYAPYSHFQVVVIFKKEN